MPLLDPELIEMFSQQFDEACAERHLMGAEKYGAVKFLDADNNLFQMLREELVDAANYARYLFIRLSAIEALLAAQLQDEPTFTHFVDDFHSDTKKD